MHLPQLLPALLEMRSNVLIPSMEKTVASGSTRSMPEVPHIRTPALVDNHWNAAVAPSTALLNC